MTEAFLVHKKTRVAIATLVVFSESDSLTEEAVEHPVAMYLPEQA